MRKLALFVALAGLLCGPAVAQSTYPTAASGNPRVQGFVNLVCDSNGANCAPPGSGAAAGYGSQVQGNVASAATDSGNPVKVGCVFNTTNPTVTTGQRVDTQCTNRGELTVSLSAAGALLSAPTAGTDTGSNAASGLTVYGRNLVFNGTTWDRMRGDTSGAYVVEVPSAVAAAGITTTASSAVSGGVVIKASAGNLYGYNVTAGASAGYVMLINATTVPADGAVTPLRCIPLAANTGIEVDMRGQPAFFSTGIVIVFSTTGCFTKTISATAFIAADAK